MVPFSLTLSDPKLRFKVSTKNSHAAYVWQLSVLYMYFTLYTYLQLSHAKPEYSAVLDFIGPAISKCADLSCCFAVLLCYRWWMNLARWQMRPNWSADWLGSVHWVCTRSGTSTPIRRSSRSYHSFCFWSSTRFLSDRLSLIVNNVKNAVYRHVNGKIAQLKQQIWELGFLVVVHIANVNVQHD